MKTLSELANEYIQSEVNSRDGMLCLASLRQCFFAGYQAARPQWISVKDRLPDVGHRILVTHRNSEDYANLTVMEARRVSDDEYCLPEDYSILAHDVDYWMPLPEPPKEK